jgi:flagellar protein FlbD
MIALHRLGHQAEEFHLNPDLIVTVEANPDTVITLTTGTKIVVAEPVQRVVEKIGLYRSAVLARAIERHPRVIEHLISPV